MVIIDYVGATSARMVGLTAVIPAWIALQRYTFPFFSGGPLVITVDVLRATLYPMLWILLAWLLLNPPTTRHFLYRREDKVWRIVLGVIYLFAVPFVILTSLEIVRTYWLQSIWVADLLLMALAPVWIGFLLAFSIPGGYARNIANERDEALDETRHWSDETRERTADRDFTEQLVEQGVSNAEAEDDQNRAAWRQRVLDRQEIQNEMRQERREALDQNQRRSVMWRAALVGLFIAVVAGAIGAAAQSVELFRFMSRYLPMILGITLVAGLIIGSLIFGARSASPLNRAFRIVGLVVVVGLLANLVFLPASSNLLAGIYADFLADAVNSIKDVGKNWGR